MTSQKQISIRSNLEPGDIGRVIALHGILYGQEYHYDHTFEGYVAEGLARFAISYDPERDRLWIAEIDDQMVGSIAIVRLAESQAQLRWFLVHPASQGRGLGRRLVDQALQFCQGRYKSILLWTVSDLTAATHLYRSVGFCRTEAKTHAVWGQVLTEEKYELLL